jgi:hypothetical protein
MQGLQATQGWGLLPPAGSCDRMQREQNRATIVRRKAAAVGQKKSKVEEEQQQVGGWGVGGRGDGAAGAL